MLKFLKGAVVFVCVATVAITVLPFGNSPDTVLSSFTSYASTDTVASSSSNLVARYNSAKITQEAAVESYATTLRDAIVWVAVDLVENYGCGAGTEEQRHTSTGIWYMGVKSSNTGLYASCHYPGCGQTDCWTYGSFEKMKASYDQMKAGTGHMHGSCAAFATFCQRMVWVDAPWNFNTSDLTHNVLQDKYEGDGSTEYIEEHALPGDLIISTAFGHTMLYIGEYTSPDGSIHYDHAIAEMSWDDDKFDCLIRDVKGGYLIPLTTEIELLADGEVVLTEDFSNVEPTPVSSEDYDEGGDESDEQAA